MNNPTPRRDTHEIMGRLAGRRPTDDAAAADHRRPTYYESATDHTPNDDWQWSTHTEPGYTYPADAHLVTLPLPIPPARPGIGLRTAAAVLAALILLGVSLALAITAEDRGPTGETEPPVTTTLLSAPARGGWWPGEFTAPKKTVQINPYTDSGVWLVPGDIPPGRYRVQVTGELGGYLARCATPDICEDQATGLVQNWSFPVGAPESTVDIADTDYSVRTSGVRLVPA